MSTRTTWMQVGVKQWCGDFERYVPAYAVAVLCAVLTILSHVSTQHTRVGTLPWLHRQQVDQQLFTGWGSYPSIYNVIDQIDRLIGVVAPALERALSEPGGDREAVFVFSGCGTSGRYVRIQITSPSV